MLQCNFFLVFCSSSILKLAEAELRWFCVSFAGEVARPAGSKQADACLAASRDFTRRPVDRNPHQSAYCMPCYRTVERRVRLKGPIAWQMLHASQPPSVCMAQTTPYGLSSVVDEFHLKD